MVEHFQMLALYNRLANERLLGACAGLPQGEWERERFGSFGSIRKTLNHILLADRVWMGRFEATPAGPTDVSSVPYPEFSEFRAARAAEDARIEHYTATLTAGALASTLHYRNLSGKPSADPLHFAVAHMFNHQTHHRGQVHVMLSQAGVTGLSLDLYRLAKPV